MPDPTNAENTDYQCFQFNDEGDIQAYVQNAESDNEVRWAGHNKKRILHFTHQGGDGNPLGQSLLWHAYYPFADLYVAERLQQWKLEHADSFLTVSYDADVPLPEMHNQLIDQIKETGEGIPVLTAPRTDFDTASVMSEEYTDSIQQRKEELRDGIASAILAPESLWTDTDNGDIDSRNLIKVFFKFRLPAILQEIAELMTWQLGKRLIDANYHNLNPEDYPVCRFQIHLDNDLRVQEGIIRQLIPYRDSDRLGEAMEEMLVGFRREWVPDDHDDSVHVDRPSGDHEEDPHSHDDGDNDNPPAKQPGETRERTDGQTESVGQVTDTEA
jgi:hypothetical protein